jgi:hypothetical protein
MPALSIIFHISHSGTMSFTEQHATLALPPCTAGDRPCRGCPQTKVTFTVTTERSSFPLLSVRRGFGEESFREQELHEDKDTSPCVTKTEAQILAGRPSGPRQNGAPRVARDGAWPSIFTHSSSEITQMLVEKITRYYQQYSDILDEVNSPLPDVNVKEICFICLLLCRWDAIRGTPRKITGSCSNSP